MLEKLKTKWFSLTLASRRVVVAIIVLLVVLSVVVIATVSTSASIKEPRVEAIWDNIRLPTSVKPQWYDVKLHIDITEEKFSGKEDIIIHVTESTGVLLLHVSSSRTKDGYRVMNITNSKIHAISEPKGEKFDVGDEVRIVHTFTNTPNDYYIMKTKTTMEPGYYKIYLEWESLLLRGLDGIYISTYKEGGEEKKLLASQMEPLAARKVMPCFDEPAFKAEFKMEITSEDIYPLVLWNMPELGKKEVSDDAEGWSTRTFEKSKIMSTYLLAFVIADFDCTETLMTAKGVKVRTCGRKSPIGKGDGVYSNEIGKIIIEKYEEFYGEPFPLPKIDSVAVPDFSAGAMENWGLILYRETALLWNEDNDSLGNKARVNTVVAHELAHQWFGNLVTMQWWNDLWLNEGFASYVEWIGTVSSEPKWNYLDYRTYSDRSRAFAIDAYSSSRPVSIGVEKPSDITAQFDSISYAKGSAILVQAKKFMDYGMTDDTKSNFKDAINNYIKKYQFNNTVQDDLYREMEKVYSKKGYKQEVNISKVMDTWTLQMNFPVLSVAQYNDDTVIISQNRFLITGSDPSDDKPSPFGYQWYVPVEYSVNNNGSQFKWLLPNSKVLIGGFDFSNDYIFVNRESSGYYVTDYSYSLYGKLLAAIKSDNTILTVSEKQGLLFDTFLLVSGGYKPMDQGLDLLAAILDSSLNNTDYIPLREVNRQLSSILLHIREETNSKDSTKRLSDQWKSHWKPKMTTLFDNNGKKYFKSSGAEKLPPKESENFQERSLIKFAVSLGCAYEVTECVEAAKQKFDAYKANKTDNKLDSNFKGTIMNVVMSVNPKDDEERVELRKNWDVLWEDYRASENQNDKQTIYYALGLIQDEATLKEFARRCLDTSLVRPSDSLYILGRSLTQTYLGCNVSWAFLKENWDDISKDFGASLFAVDSYISGVLSSFANQAILNEIEEFFSTRMDSLGSGKAAYHGAIQSIKANIAWVEKHKQSIENFLTQS